VADEHTNTFDGEADRLERVIASKESEIQRLRTELALKTLYVDELQATLDAQARELEAFDARLRRMEANRNPLPRQSPPRTASAEPASPPRPARATPLLIRIRRAIRD
jgi:septal ring factor EnvC (AmiA/AmiB activator)